MSCGFTVISGSEMWPRIQSLCIRGAFSGANVAPYTELLYTRRLFKRKRRPIYRAIVYGAPFQAQTSPCIQRDCIQGAFSSANVALYTERLYTGCLFKRKRRPVYTERLYKGRLFRCKCCPIYRAIVYRAPFQSQTSPCIQSDCIRGTFSSANVAPYTERLYTGHLFSRKRRPIYRAIVYGAPFQAQMSPRIQSDCIRGAFSSANVAPYTEHAHACRHICIAS
jgi:hypothetical protein